MKKILQILNSYIPAYKFGGANKLMYEYAKLLNDKYDIVVFTTDVKNDYERITKKEQKKYNKKFKIRYFYNIFPYLSSRYNITFSVTLWFNVIKNFKNYDYIHICEIRGILPFIVTLMSILNNKIILIHSSFGMLSSKPSNLLKKYLIKIYDKIFLKLLIKRIDIALCESKQEIEQYRKYNYKKKCVIVPHVVDEFKNKVCKKEYLFSKKKINILFLGRLHKNKGVINAIKFVKILHSIDNSYTLSIVGNDEGDLGNIKHYIEKNNIGNFVQILSPIYGNKRFCLYNEAKFFILLPIVNLETSLASIEALSQNCFIIFNNNSYIENAETSFAGVNIDNFISMKEAALYIHNNIKNIGTKPFEYFRKYNSRKQIKKLLVKEIFCS